ncbi:MAG: hypothetical protein ACK5MZ_01335 [Aestuariibaculum sp.]
MNNKVFTKNDQLNKMILATTQQLHPYAKHRLYIGESVGILPKNMYSSNGIINESIIRYFKNNDILEISSEALKRELFKQTDQELYSVFKKEAFHKDTISTNTFLNEEIDGLDEHFTVDEDFDFIMDDELSDISYKQNKYHKESFLYSDEGNLILNAFKVIVPKHKSTRDFIGSMYSRLPLNVSSIVDLYVFGKLSVYEIAHVKDIEPKRVNRILETVKQTFETNLY